MGAVTCDSKEIFFSVLYFWGRVCVCGYCVDVRSMINPLKSMSSCSRPFLFDSLSQCILFIDFNLGEIADDNGEALDSCHVHLASFFEYISSISEF